MEKLCFLRSRCLGYLSGLILTIFIINLTLNAFPDGQVSPSLSLKQKEKMDLNILKPKNPLDGCLHVYLDVGANRGVQVRKLFEPHLFPTARILRTFNKYFGNFHDRNLSQICAVGFEPNPVHASWLAQLAKAYRKCGWRVHFKTKTGVDKKYSDSARYAWFNTVMEKDVGQAGRIVEHTRDFEKEQVVLGRKVVRKFENLTTIRLAEYILDVVGERKLPNSSIAPKVIMKMDIEGKELEVMLDMILKGALGVLDEVHMEWSKDGPFVDVEGTKNLKHAVQVINQLASQYGLLHQCPIEELDDETYYDYNESLPIC